MPRARARARTDDGKQEPIVSRIMVFILCVAVTVAAASAFGQSSSLFVRAAVQRPPPAADPPPDPDGSALVIPQPPVRSGRPPALSPAIARASFVAIGRPAPRKFSVHDLVTIIIRETITNDAESLLETEKNFKKQGKITALPSLRLGDLLQLQSRQANFSDRGEPEINLKLNSDFKGEGKHRQRQTFTARITARIIDVKPNGTLVLEARKKIRADTEAFSMVLTGTCRKDDISADNTIRSDQLYDMDLIKQQIGELKKATKKGLLTKVFEAIFNF